LIASKRPNPKKNKTGENRESKIQIRPSTGSLKNQHQYPKAEKPKRPDPEKNQLNPKSVKDHLSPKSVKDHLNRNPKKLYHKVQFILDEKV
jgi:hypothetical protein